MTLSFSSLSGGTSFTVITSTGGSKTATLSKTFPAGTYLIESMAGDTNLEIYLGASDGTQVGSCVAGAKSVTASASFLYVTTVNADTNDAVTFTLKSAATLATKTDAVWAPPTITDITPSGLPNVDDTTTITGTNFATNVEVKFRKSDNSTLVSPKTTVRGSATSIIAGRPDSFAPGDAPYDVIVTNPSTTLSATSLNAITSGAVPVWVTSNTLNAATIGTSFSQTIQATDADGGSSITYAIVSGSLQTGLSLNTSTGAITGTPTGSAGTTTVTISATDSGANTVNRTFTQVVDPEGLVVEYIVVAGGGGAPGYNSAGGGGAGGYRSSVIGEMSGGGASAESRLSLEINTAYTVTIGAGGRGALADTANSPVASGNNSVFSSITSIGGGRGGNAQPGAPAPASGGSGGGSRGQGTPGTDANATGGAGTNGQGYKGGNSGTAYYDVNYPGGGGGGAGGAAANVSSTTTATAGGIGVQSSITGTATYYAGGGGGSAQGGGTSGAGGLGGGGNAGSGAVGSFAGEDGAVNSGGGGGAGNTRTGGSGGSGIVIVRYQSPTRLASGGDTIAQVGQYWVHTFKSSGIFNTTPSYTAKATGGTVTTDGTYWIHTFTASGIFTPIQSLTCDYLVVAGGGGGGGDFGGGGGAGAFRSGSSFSVNAQNYSITVGAGGVGSRYASHTVGTGGNSVFSTITSLGGGKGGTDFGVAAGSGGSGGGGTAGSTGGGSGTTGGNNGGSGANSNPNYSGGGGGGAGAVGGNASGSTGGNGGIGLTSSISGTSTYYAGGGGGFGSNEGGTTSTFGTGGLGGGGNGGRNTISENNLLLAQSGTANTGGGGGGASNRSVAYPGGNGGSGIVIIRYPV